MKRIDINQGWLLSLPGGIFDSFAGDTVGCRVDLPHDAMIEDFIKNVGEA